MDRALRRLCELPLFGHKVRDVLELLGLVTVEQFLAFEAKQGSDFFGQLVVVAPSLLERLEEQKQEAILGSVLELRAILETLWHLLNKGAEGFLKENAAAHGFGLADWSREAPKSRPQKRSWESIGNRDKDLKARRRLC